MGLAFVSTTGSGCYLPEHKMFVFVIRLVARDTADVMSRDYELTSPALLKLRAPCFGLAFLVAARQTRRESSRSAFEIFFMTKHLQESRPVTRRVGEDMFMGG